MNGFNQTLRYTFETESRIIVKARSMPYMASRCHMVLSVKGKRMTRDSK